MPYGVDKSIGGDSKENVSFMERCVSKITGTNKRTKQPYTKGEKIAICKSQLKKNKSEFISLEEINISESTYSLIDNIVGDAVSKLMSTNKVSSIEDALKIVETTLDRTNHDLDNFKLLILR